jgi:DNA polymerase-3 subunit gamma/tau
MISESEIKLINDYSKNLDSQDLGIFWQLTIKTMDDLRVVGNENLSLEMYIMQLMHLKKIDQKEEALIESYSNEESLGTKNSLVSSSEEQDDKKIKSVYKNQLKNTEQVKTNLIKNPELRSQLSKNLSIKTFKDLRQAATNEKEVELKYDLERNVKLVSFAPGKINISFNEKLNKNFIKNLTEQLLKWTAERWIISLSKEQGEETIYEKNLINKKSKLDEETNSQAVKDFLNAFPDAKLVDVTEENDA